MAMIDEEFLQSGLAASGMVSGCQRKRQQTSKQLQAQLLHHDDDHDHDDDDADDYDDDGDDDDEAAGNDNDDADDDDEDDDDDDDYTDTDADADAGVFSCTTAKGRVFSLRTFSILIPPLKLQKVVGPETSSMQKVQGISR